MVPEASGLEMPRRWSSQVPAWRGSLCPGGPSYDLEVPATSQSAPAGRRGRRDRGLVGHRPGRQRLRRCPGRHRWFGRCRRRDGQPGAADPDLHRDRPGRQPEPPGRRVRRQRHGVRVEHRRGRGLDDRQRHHHGLRRVAVAHSASTATAARPRARRCTIRAAPPRTPRATSSSPTAATTWSARSRRTGSSTGSPGTGIAGLGVAGSRSHGFPATLSSLDRPQAVAVNAQGDVFVADTYNNRVVEVTPSGTVSDRRR